MLLLALVVSDGLGIKLEVDTDLVVPDASKTLREGSASTLESYFI